MCTRLLQAVFPLELTKVSSLPPVVPPLTEFLALLPLLEFPRVRRDSQLRVPLVPSFVRRDRAEARVGRVTPRRSGSIAQQTLAILVLPGQVIRRARYRSLIIRVIRMIWKQLALDLVQPLLDYRAVQAVVQLHVPLDVFVQVHRVRRPGVVAVLLVTGKVFVVGPLSLFRLLLLVFLSRIFRREEARQQTTKAQLPLLLLLSSLLRRRRRRRRPRGSASRLHGELSDQIRVPVRSEAIADDNRKVHAVRAGRATRDHHLVTLVTPCRSLPISRIITITLGCYLSPLFVVELLRSVVIGVVVVVDLLLFDILLQRLDPLLETTRVRVDGAERAVAEDLLASSPRRAEEIDRCCQCPRS